MLINGSSNSRGHDRNSAHELMSKGSESGKQSPSKVIGLPGVAYVLFPQKVV